jgi:hypothetical protein
MKERYVVLSESGRQKAGKPFLETTTDRILERTDGSLSVEEYTPGRPGRTWLLKSEDLRVIEVDRPSEPQHWRRDAPDQDLWFVSAVAGA